MEWADKIFEELQKDLTIDKANIGDESIRISSNVFWKYQRLHAEAVIELEKLKVGYGALYIKRWNVLKGNGTPEENKNDPYTDIKMTSVEKKQVLENDEILSKARISIAIQEQKVEIYKSCIWQLKEVMKAAKIYFDDVKFKSGA